MNSEDAIPIRKRMRRWEETGAVRFVTFSCHHRLALFGNASICDLFVDVLQTTRQRHEFKLFAWVVMPEHVHMMLTPKDGALMGDALRSLKTSVAKKVVHRWIQLDAPILEKLRTARGDVRFWQKGGGFDRNVRDP